MTVVSVAGLLLLLSLAVAVVVSAPSAQIVRRRKSRVVVTLKSGAAFQGVLFATDRRVWVLRETVALAAAQDNGNVPADGEVLIFTADIEYVQKP